MSTKSLMLSVRAALQTISLPSSDKSGPNSDRIGEITDVPSDTNGAERGPSGSLPSSTTPNIITSGLVENLTVSPSGVAKIILSSNRLSPLHLKELAATIEATLARVDGVARTVVAGSSRPSDDTTTATGPFEATPSDPAKGPQPPSLTAETSGSMPTPASSRRANLHANPLGLSSKRKRIEAGATGLSQTDVVIAVASGKGGVGKSTFAANLAAAMAAKGLSTGLLDADIYGPSLPTLLAAGDQLPQLKDGRIQPIKAQGILAMSIGNLIDPKKALAWRGPMVMGAVRQMINDVDWGPLDVLIVDTPPGTGDAHLTLGQMRRGTSPSDAAENTEGEDRPALDGAVIVSTPQELALADVRRGVEFFRKLSIPIFGIVENMAYFETQDGTPEYIFGQGGAEKAAQSLDVPFLGALPLLPTLREASDKGILLADETIETHFAKLAHQILASAQKKNPN
ncbi:MAG: P-loop NTPase [Pseudomonadota bacterium]